MEVLYYMSTWIRPAGGNAKALTGDAGGWTGYLKVREDPTITSKEVKKQNRLFKEAVKTCKDKDEPIPDCVSNELG